MEENIMFGGVNIWEHGGDIVAVFSAMFIFIKGFIEYMVALDYSEYYKIPMKNFGIRDIKRFIGRVVLFVSICSLPILMVYISKDFQDFFKLDKIQTMNLQILLILFASILIYVLTIKELFPKIKIKTRISPVFFIILVSFILALILRAIISCLFEPSKFFDKTLLFIISTYVFCGLYLSFRNQKFNPSKIKEYEIYTKIKGNNDASQEKEEYIVIQDYDDKVLSVKAYKKDKSQGNTLHGDILNLDLDNFYHDDKKDKEFTYKKYEKVYRWKDGTNLDKDKYKNKGNIKELIDRKFLKIKKWWKNLKYKCKKCNKKTRM